MEILRNHASGVQQGVEERHNDAAESLVELVNHPMGESCEVVKSTGSAVAPDC